MPKDERRSSGESAAHPWAGAKIFLIRRLLIYLLDLPNKYD